MATCNTGVLSPFSGQVGPVVGAVLKSINVIRKRPNPSKKPPKQSQIDQRAKFALAMEFVRGQAETFRVGYKTNKGGLAPLNVAASHLLKNAITGISPDFELDYPQIVFSKGNLIITAELEMVPQPLGIMKFSWSLDGIREEQKAERGKDKGYVVMYNEELNLSNFSDGAFTRSQLTYQMKSPKMFIGKTVHVWFFFASADGEKVCNSVYLGSEVILA